MSSYATVVVGTDGSNTSFVADDRGLNSFAGRILASVPSDVARHAGIDVLIVPQHVT
jgi:nucleotide-binding universal stress UspA family protein